MYIVGCRRVRLVMKRILKFEDLNLSSNADLYVFNVRFKVTEEFININTRI